MRTHLQDKQNLTFFSRLNSTTGARGAKPPHNCALAFQARTLPAARESGGPYLGDYYSSDAYKYMLGQ